MQTMNDTRFSIDHQPETTTRTRLSIEQEIAQLEAKLARKREAQRKLLDGQKIIIGGMMLALAENDSAARKRLAELIERHVTRPADVKRIAPLLAELQQGAAPAAHADAEKAKGVGA